MNIMLKSFAVSALALAIAGCGAETNTYQVDNIDQASNDDQQAYALGTSVGRYVAENLDHQEDAEIMLDREVVIGAFIDAVRGESQMDEERADELLGQLRDRVIEQRQTVVGDRARQQGEEYRQEHAQREGVEVTESGLQYEVIREGDGEQPDADSVVQVHYEGRLVTGEVFDSSYERGEPATFPLNRVISGWTEGLQLMSVGAHYRFVIPSEIAYGSREVAGGSIPPNSTLVFDVELLDIITQDENQ